MGTHRLWCQPEPPLPHHSSLAPHLCDTPDHFLLHHHRFIMVLEGSGLLCCLHQIVRRSLYCIASSLQQGREGEAALVTALGYKCCLGGVKNPCPRPGWQAGQAARSAGSCRLGFLYMAHCLATRS